MIYMGIPGLSQDAYGSMGALGRDPMNPMDPTVGAVGRGGSMYGMAQGPSVRQFAPQNLMGDSNPASIGFRPQSWASIYQSAFDPSGNKNWAADYYGALYGQDLTNNYDAQFRAAQDFNQRGAYAQAMGYGDLFNEQGQFIPKMADPNFQSSRSIAHGTGQYNYDPFFGTFTGGYVGNTNYGGKNYDRLGLQPQIQYMPEKK